MHRFLNVWRALISVGVLWFLIASGGLLAQQPESQAITEPEVSPTPEAVDPLVSIRDDLVQLRLEQALAKLESLLIDPALDESARVEAWILRSQVHAAYGDLDATEADYRQILQWRPAYRPDTTLTPAKAMARWQKVRNELVGAVELTLIPWSARVLVDGRETVPDAERRVELLGGDHELRIVAEGYDEERRLVSIEVGTLLPLEFKLIPNSRDLVFRTTMPDVAVQIDGVPVGNTQSPEVGTDGYAELEVPHVPLGEHVYQFEKHCFRTEAFEDFLSVDLMDTQAKRFQPLTLEPASGSLVLEMEPGGEILFDGVVAGPGPWTFCPGEVLVEWRLGGRTVWRNRVQIEDGLAATYRLVPRPTVAVFSLDEWPLELRAWGESYSLERRNRSLPENAENPVSWAGESFGPSVDLAIGRRRGAGDRFEWVFYQPGLRHVDLLPELPDVDLRPRWVELSVGWVLAEVPGMQRTLITRLRAGGPAAQAGLAAGDQLLPTADGAVYELLADGGWRVRVDSPGAEPRSFDLTPQLAPRWTAGPDPELPKSLWAAWAAVATRTTGSAGHAAMLNLAVAWIEAGRPRDAIALLDRIHGSHAGVGEGAAAYLLGRARGQLGEEEAAAEAFRIAVEANQPLGAGQVPVAPAARDQLSDLGAR